MGCTDPLPPVSFRVSSLPLCADVRFHIPMTDRNDAGTVTRTGRVGRTKQQQHAKGTSMGMGMGTAVRYQLQLLLRVGHTATRYARILASVACTPPVFTPFSHLLARVGMPALSMKGGQLCLQCVEWTALLGPILLTMCGVDGVARASFAYNVWSGRRC